jgi:hypothetical protein
MHALIWCLIITSCIAYIYHLDAPNEVVSAFMGWITKGKIKRVELRKPFGCPLCMTFWITLALLLVLTPKFWFMSLVFAFSVKYIDYTITVLESALDRLFSWLETILKK